MARSYTSECTAALGGNTRVAMDLLDPSDNKKQKEQKKAYEHVTSGHIHEQNRKDEAIRSISELKKQGPLLGKSTYVSSNIVDSERPRDWLITYDLETFNHDDSCKICTLPRVQVNARRSNIKNLRITAGKVRLLELFNNGKTIAEVLYWIKRVCRRNVSYSELYCHLRDHCIVSKVADAHKAKRSTNVSTGAEDTAELKTVQLDEGTVFGIDDDNVDFNIDVKLDEIEEMTGEKCHVHDPKCLICNLPNERIDTDEKRIWIGGRVEIERLHIEEGVSYSSLSQYIYQKAAMAIALNVINRHFKEHVRVKKTAGLKYTELWEARTVRESKDVIEKAIVKRLTDTEILDHVIRNMFEIHSVAFPVIKDSISDSKKVHRSVIDANDSAVRELRMCIKQKSELLGNDPLTKLTQSVALTFEEMQKRFVQSQEKAQQETPQLNSTNAPDSPNGAGAVPAATPNAEKVNMPAGYKPVAVSK